jgi:hypothetical protein
MTAMASLSVETAAEDPVLAAIRRAPAGRPMTAAERARIAEVEGTPGAWSTTEDFMARLAALGPGGDPDGE